MTLACPLESESFQIALPVLLAFVLIAPLVVFLLLPKRMPLKQELRFAFATALWPLAWLASRLAGDRCEASGWGPRLTRAIGHATERAHPAGESGEVVRDARLLSRARYVAWAAAALPMAAAVIAFFALVNPNNTPATAVKFTIAALPALAAASWVAWVGALSAALWAQAMALGRGHVARLSSGALIGVGYGALTGFTVGLAFTAIGVPLMSLLMGDAPSLHELYWLHVGAGGVAAALGAFTGLVLLVPLAAGAARSVTRARGA